MTSFSPQSSAKLITSRENPSFKHLRALAEESRYRREQGATLLDGAHLILSALEAGVPLKRLVVSAGAADHTEVAQLLELHAKGREVLAFPDALFKAISPVQTPSGILAEIATPDPKASSPTQDALVLAGVQDVGNLGTLLRTAAAAGVTQAWLDSQCAQAWSPKVLRAGMGAHFKINIIEHADLPALLADYAGQSAATALSARAKSLYQLDLKGPTAWMFGSEGQGLPQDLLHGAALQVMIPMPGQTESLNVAAAAAICLFEQVRQRL